MTQTHELTNWSDVWPRAKMSMAFPDIDLESRDTSWQETHADTLADVTDIMDRLENHGITEMHLEVDPNYGYFVHWRITP